MDELSASILPYLPDWKVNENDIHQSLAAYLDYLITNDFQKLVFLLYRLDINENKLQLLINNVSDNTAGEIMATMIIERQLQKIESRKVFKPTDQPNDSNEEKW